MLCLPFAISDNVCSLERSCGGIATCSEPPAVVPVLDMVALSFGVRA